LALNNALTAQPAYEESIGYFPIGADRIVSYDLNTGTMKWIVPGRPHLALAARDQLAFFVDVEALVALRSADGSVAWRIPFADAIVAPLAVNHGWLAAVTKDGLLMFRAADGTLAWRFETGAPPHAAPAVTGERVYVPLEDGRVIALGLSGRDVIWEHRLGGAANEILALDDRVFVGSDDDFLYCLNPQDGEVEWRWRTGGDVVRMPLADEHRVYFVSLDNVVRALNQRNGVQQWKRALSFRPVWPPQRAADSVIVTGLAGPVNAFYLKDGAPAGEMGLGAGVELAAPLYAFGSPPAVSPTIVSVTRSLTSGATVTASSRSIEPPLIPMLQPLPGVLTVSATSSR
jgi:outer membrane protein assembly factor BamB